MPAGESCLGTPVVAGIDTDKDLHRVDARASSQGGSDSTPAFASPASRAARQRGARSIPPYLPTPRMRLQRNLTSNSAPIPSDLCTSPAHFGLSASLNLCAPVRAALCPSLLVPCALDCSPQRPPQVAGSPLQRLIAASLALDQTPSIRL